MYYIGYFLVFLIGALMVFINKYNLDIIESNPSFKYSPIFLWRYKSSLIVGYAIMILPLLFVLFDLVYRK